MHGSCIGYDSCVWQLCMAAVHGSCMEYGSWMGYGRCACQLYEVWQLDGVWQLYGVWQLDGVWQLYMAAYGV